MNLKRLVGLMGLLGVISTPVFAQTDMSNPSATTSTAASSTTATGTSTAPVHHKRKHHKVVVHHHRVIVHHAVVVPADYKDMGALPVQPATEVCAISQTSMVMDQTTQSIGRSMPSPCNPGWFNRVQVSGGVNIDLGKWGDRNANIMGENYRPISLNDAYLNIGAVINDWAKAFASLSYSDPTINDPEANALANNHVAEYSPAYTANVSSGSSPSLQLEQGYVTLGNFEVSPIYVQLGKQFQDFSRYDIHPITYSMTQVLSETLAPSGKVGFIAGGFNGSVFVLDNPINEVNKTATATNYGASLGFDMPSDQFGWSVGAAYMYNLIGANAVAYNVNQYNVVLNANNEPGYHTRVGAAALYADMNTGPFTLDLRYTAALQRFNATDLPKDGDGNLTLNPNGDVVLAANTSGAKPWAFGAQAGYGFDAWSKTQNIYLGYQTSNQASGLMLPKYRYLAGYGVDVWKSTNLGLEWDHDSAYSVAHGGTGNTTNLVSIRAAVQFG